MIYAFGSFTLDTEARQLCRDGQPLALSGKAFELIRFLIERRPRAIDKRELRDHLWPDTIVVDAGLPVLIREIRRVLGAERDVIRTVHRFGYAFAGAVRDGTATRSHREDGPFHLLLHPEREFRLAEGESVVGRDPKAEVFLPSTTVSRHHAVITVRDRAAILGDLESKNGTRVDGVLVTGPRPLHDGCIIRFGTIEVVYRCASADFDTETATLLR